MKGFDKAMKTVAIFADKVFSNAEEVDSKDYPAFEEFKDFPIILNNFRTYILRHHNIALSKRHDYDGYPFEDFFEFEFGVARHFDSSKSLSMTITYTGSSSSDYSYQAEVSRSLSTAYKWRSSGKVEKTNFSLYRAFIEHREEISVSELKDIIRELRETARFLEDSTSSLGAWSKSGLAMAVTCKGLGCSRRFVQDSPSLLSRDALETLAAKGLTLEEVKSRLRCKECGSGCRSIIPY